MAKRAKPRTRSDHAGHAAASRAAAGQVDDSDIPVVGPREPCPCGSGRRYKACHGRAARSSATPFVARPFEGLADECDWVAMREFVSAGTAKLTLAGDHGDRTARVATLLPMVAPGLVTPEGEIVLGLQVPGVSGDPSRDHAAALEALFEAEPGTLLPAAGLVRPGPRLQDLLDPTAPLEVEVHDSFDYWTGLLPDETGVVAASIERANSVVVPTKRLAGVAAAYWCQIGAKSYLRWVRPEPEDALVDAFARLHVQGADTVGEGTRSIGAFRAHGLLVSVWELPEGTDAGALEEPAREFDGRLQEALAVEKPLDAAERAARAGLLNRQRTLR